ncbi:MAG: hypothetical protein ACRDPH_09325 [Marmoricola sp.]
MRCADLTDVEELVRDLKAWLLVLPHDAVFTHVTAAALYGWSLPKLPEAVPVFAATADDTRPRRPGLGCSRLRRNARPRRRLGLPVDAPEEVLLRAARDLAVLDLVPMVDSALRHDVELEELESICRSRRPGVRRLREAVALADSRPESGWESRLRVFHVLIGLDVEPQKQLFAPDGRPLGRADLLIRGTDMVQEYDGAVHANRAVRQRDLRRARRIAETPYVRRGYTADDLINHDLAVLQEIDRALGRRSTPSRLQKWRAWVAESTYSPAGRARLQNRWRVILTPRHWSGNART